MSNRDIDIAHLYHESTKLFYLELHKKPPAYKLYRELPLLPLPTDFSPLAVPALEAIAATGQMAPPTRAFDLTMLAGLLFFAAGRIKKRTFAGVGEVSFRAAASAGGLYPVEVYVVCGELPGLAAGVYHFSPADFALRSLRQGDYRPVLAQAAAGDQTVTTAPCTLVCSAIFWRSAWKYRVRSYRYCFWDNGTIVANLFAVTAAAGLPARVVMGFVDAQVNHLLGLDGHREASTCLVSIGPSADLLSLEHPGQVLALVAETIPHTRVEVDYPEITRLHAASTLTTPEEVMAWRVPHMRQPGRNVAPQHPLHPLDAVIAPSPSLGDVIRQRGSTRRFARESMSFAQLSAILSAATTGLPADFLGQNSGSLLDIYLIVHAVAGLPAGSYVFAPQARALELLTAGSYRDAAGHLCFEQALGADASVVVFFLADLTDVLQRFGNRGYRAVQLEAGAVGGKMYLGTGALGLGASGLTFYDDEVTAFFAPHAAGKSPIFVVALGHTARENRVQPFRSRAAMAIDAMSRRDF